MFDIKWIRANAEHFDAALKRRGMAPQAANLLSLDNDRRSTVLALNEAQERRNAASKQIGQAKAQGDEEKFQALMAEVSGLKQAVQTGEETERAQTLALHDALAGLPNVLAKSVPDGGDETENVERSRFKEPKNFDFEPKEHFELGEALGLMDFEAATRIAGSRFVVLKGALARLERAIGQFMLDVQTEEHGYTETQTPLLVRDEALFGTGQLPKFAEDAFETKDGRWLIPTAEVPLTNLVREQILAEDQLPIRVTALTPCFRSEAGSAGRDTRGMLRQHQFNKVEMVVVTTAENADAEHERMLDNAETILKKLDIPYRVVSLCSGDMGASMQRTFDIEGWMPGQNTFREISSISSAGDYQARRMDARYRAKDGEVHYVHTLNGSGLAVGRTMIAVMENYQNADGSIDVPAVLQPYMGGMTKIGTPS